MALPLDEFLQKAQVAQLTPEEFASELQAQYNIDMSKLGKTYTQMGQVFGGAPQVPEGMRQKEWYEEIMEPISMGAGVVGGAVEKAAAVAKPMAREMVGLPQLKTPEELELTKEIREARTDIDKLVQERMDEDALEALRLDVRDNLEGILEIINALRVTGDYIPAERGTAEHLAATMEEGGKLGGAMVTGTIADIGKMGDDPREYVLARPATSLMMVAPLIQELVALKGTMPGVAPAILNRPEVKKAIEAVEKQSNKIKETIKQTKLGVKAERKLRQTGLEGAERFRDLKRLVSDPTIQATERASKFVDELMNEVKRTGDSITTIAERFKNSVKEGYIPPIKDKPLVEYGGLKLPTKKIKDVGLDPGRTTYTPEGAKILIQDYDYQPTAKHIGASREAQQMIAEGMELQDPSSWEKFIRQSDAEPVEVRVKQASLLKTVDDFLDDIEKIDGVNRDEAKTAFVKNFVEVSVGALKSDIVKSKVIEKAMAALEEADFLSKEQLIRAEEALGRFLEEMNKREPGARNYGNNAIINYGKQEIRDMAGNVVGFSPPKVTLDIAKMTYDIITGDGPDPFVQAELLQRTGSDIANLARREKIAKSASANMGSQNTISGWLDEHMPKIIEGGELPPAVPMNAHQIASFLADTAESLAKKYGVTPEVIGDIGFKLRSYKRMDPEIAEHFGLTDYLKSKRDIPEAKEGRLSYEIFAPDGVNSTLKYEMDAYKAVHEARGFFGWLNSRVKGNITARNLASAINNITGNFAYQTFRRGSPLLAADLIKWATKYRAWRKGEQIGTKKGSPLYITDEEKNFLKALERSGYLDTDVVDVELGGIGKSGKGLLGKMGLTKMENILEGFYKGGDNIFKIEDAWYNYKQLSREIDVLNDGEWIDLDLEGKGKWTRLYRKGSDFTLDGKVLTKDKLDDVLSRASIQPGKKIFVDYSDVPNMVKMVRASKALGMTSPFFTWAWQVMDAPGKKGIGFHALNDRAITRTNSKALNAVKLSKATLTGIRRQVVIGAMREAILAEDDETLRKVLAYSPKEFNLQLLETLGSPFYIGHDSMESANQFAPSDAILRGIMSLKAGGIDHIRDEEMQRLYTDTIDGDGNIDYMLETIEDPELRREIRARRSLIKKKLSDEAFTTGDALNLIGLSGTPIMDVVVMMQVADKQGKTVNKRQLYQSGLTAVMGGTAARLLEIGMAGLFPEASRAFTTRAWAENPIGGEQEEFIKWAMRRVTGLGFRPLDAANRSKWYWINKSREWKSALTEDLRDSLEDPAITEQDRENIAARIIELEKIVDGEIMMEKLHFQKILEKMNIKKKR